MTQSPLSYIRQSGSSRRAWIFWLVLTCGALLIISMIIGAPLARAGSHPLFAFAVYKGFSAVCHQLPERSFYIAGYPFAVCARCTGLYVGFSVALLGYPLVVSLRRTFAPPRRWLLLAAIPMAVDVTLTFLGIWENTHTSRFATGALLGAVAVFYVMPGISDLALRGFRASKSQPLATLTTTVSSGPIPAPSDYSAPHRRI